MRVLFLTLFLTGCAAIAPYSYQERCAFDGMVVSGVTKGHSSAFVSGPNGWASGSGRSEALSCEPPKTEMQSCEIRRMNSISQPKAAYNSNLGWWNTGIWTGYVFWVIPGVGLKMWADSKYDDAMDAAGKIASETSRACVPPKEYPQEPEVRSPTSD